MDDVDPRREALLAALKALDERQAIARRQYQEGFAGLLGRIPEGASPLIISIIREIEQFLLLKYSAERARQLLGTAKAMGSDPEMAKIPEGDLLALSILSKIHHALDAEGHRSIVVLLGTAGAHEYKRREASRKERHPAITAWIRKQLAVDPSAKSPDLYRRAPTFVTDVVQEGRFRKRVTAERKRKKDASK